MESTVQAMLVESLDGMNENGQIDLVRAMLADASQMTNVLGSWLEKKRRWLSLFPEEVREHYTCEAITATAGEACAGIVAKNEERHCWGRLGAIVGDVPPSESTRTAVENALLGADLMDYIHRDPALAVDAMGVMVLQAPYVGSEVRDRIKAQFLTVAAEVGDARLERKGLEKIADLIVAGLIGCTWCQPEGEARASALATLLERLAEGNSSPVFVRSGALILFLCDTLPVNQAQYFWRVRDLLRLKSRW